MGTGTTVKDFHEVQAKLKLIYPQIERQLKQRATSGSRELFNAWERIMREDGGGKTYRKPGTIHSTYKASKAGEPPAVRTGTLRTGKRMILDGSLSPAIESGIKYAHYLQNGTSKMDQRPIIEPTLNEAKPEILKIYKQPFKINI